MDSSTVTEVSVTLMMILFGMLGRAWIVTVDFYWGLCYMYDILLRPPRWILQRFDSPVTNKAILSVLTQFLTFEMAYSWLSLFNVRVSSSTLTIEDYDLSCLLSELVFNTPWHFLRGCISTVAYTVLLQVYHAELWQPARWLLLTQNSRIGKRYNLTTNQCVKFVLIG